LTPLFVEILLIAQQIGCLKLGKVSLDGTKIKANASKHRALSWKHACKLETQIKAEVADLLRQAEEADHRELADGLDIPAELARREERLNAIASAKAEIERRAANRYAEEQADYETKLTKRKAEEQETGKKPVASNPSHQYPVLGIKTKSTSQMKNPGLCQFPAEALTNATMLKPVSMLRQC
jgi:hypothetical protein